MYDLIIIGGATAGLTAGIYAARKKINTVILTKKIGGQSLLTDTIENFPGFESVSGGELIQKIKAQVEKHGLPIKEGGEVESIRQLADKKESGFIVKIKNGEELTAKSLIVATGKNPRLLNVPGEEEFKNKGVSFCSTCDAPLYGGKDVAVVGSGNSGLNAAFDLVKYANKIYVFESGSEIKGDELLRDKLKESGKVEFIVNAKVKEIKGSNFVEKVVYKNGKSREEKELPIGGIFVNVGWTPNSGFLKGFIDLNEFGEVVINPRTNQTSIPGIFAAGDVTDIKHKQCVVAAGEGAKAALSAYEYLKK